MRTFLGVGLALLSSLAPCDELLLIPTARRLTDGALRGEVWSRDRLAEGSLAVGFGGHFEAMASIDDFDANRGRLSGSVAYHYLSPIADITPGIAGGILDVANETTDGRRVYVCATLNRSLPGLSRFGYAQLTGGFEVGLHAAPIVGIRLPLDQSLAMLSEYDGFRFNAGIELQAGQGAYARIALRGSTAYAVIGIRR